MLLRAGRSRHQQPKVLLVEQGRVLDEGGAFKVTYPSKADLVFEKQKSTSTEFKSVVQVKIMLGKAFMYLSQCV